ncbi:MAG TPA: hypothetical protein VNA04_13495 [Thermoanaerobaculia bacterium]|nr:hypothetical protein [Thermoanaerobaculia bacterium]
MRRSLLLSTVLFLVAASAFAHGRHGSNLNVSFDGGDVALLGCDALSVRFGGERVPVVAEEIPFHGSALRVRAEGNGSGIRAAGWSGNSYGVTACKAVAPGVDPGSVRAILAGNEVTATGPDDERWVVYFLIRTPRGASLDLRSTNGPVSVSNVNGTVHAEAVNGPVSIKESSGSIIALTTNGPVSVSGGSGDIRLEATNGPVSVKLFETTWNGNLDASTRNGPVSLKLPRGFRSGVTVEALGNGPVTCRAEGCPDLRIHPFERERPRRIELGSGPRVVRVSTVNGPVSVKETE